MASQPSPDRPLSLVSPDRSGELSQQLSTGELMAAISNRIVRLLSQHTGRGPTKAKTTVSADVVVVTLADCLTTVEKRLAGSGATELVTQARSVLHRGIGADAIAVVEELTSRQVTAYLTDQQVDPDLAVIVFLLAPSPLRPA